MPGFFAAAAPLASALVETLVDRTTGTLIGDFTDRGGLSALFDGTTNQANIACGGHNNADINTFYYAGKTFGAAKIPSKLVIFGSNTDGYFHNGTPIVARFYAKNGTPANATDGTLLGSISFTSSSNESTGRSIDSSDKSTPYTSWWVAIEFTSGSTNDLFMAEIQMYEML